MNALTTLALALVLGAATASAQPAAEGPPAAVKIGDTAPTFDTTDDQGKTWTTGDHVGKKVIVVYFYPADFTGGCTKQACGFRDDFQKLADKGIFVVGISGDSAKTHALFKKEHKLPFTLLADEKGDIAKKFGVPTRAGGVVKVKVDGKEEELKRGVTASRWTFVIGKNGKVAYKNDKVNAAEDSKKILEVIEKLNQ